MESNIVLPIVAFLSTIIIGGILLYFYLRHEQDKVIPKDPYNEAQAEIYTRRKHRPYNPTISSIIVSRLLIFYSTFVVVVALSVFVMGIMSGLGVLENIGQVLHTIVGTIVGARFSY